MQRILFYIVYAFLWVISILPFPIFYFISDCIYVLVYRIIGYRKKTVRDNIKLTLPHLTDKEVLQVEKKFYHHMCDMFMEMIKSMNISEEEMKKRFVFTNLEVYKDFEAKNKSIIVMYAHYASWEWSITLVPYAKFICFGIYKKIKNPYFDKLVQDIRLKFGGVLIDTKNTVKTIKENEEKGILGVYGFISDQTPSLKKAKYWDNFMGHFVPIHTGSENLARELDMNVLYLKVMKTKRGHYEATFIPITDDAKSMPENEITKRFITEVEKQIYEAPEYYFWTHKRWKFKKEKAQ